MRDTIAVSSGIPEPVSMFRIASRRAWKMRSGSARIENSTSIEVDHYHRIPSLSVSATNNAHIVAWDTV